MEKSVEHITLTKDIVQGILKTKKLLKMYPLNNPIYSKTAAELHNKFQNFFKFTDELSLKIYLNEITFNNEQVYYHLQKDDNLALSFFKDGIRQITFLNGFAQKELEDFIQILNTDFEKDAADDDMVTLLWERDFEHIKYVVVEEILTEEETYDRDKIYEEVKSKSCSDESLVKAYSYGLEPHEKEEKSATEMILPITETDLKILEKEIREEDTHPKIDKIITILFELLYQTNETQLFPEIVDFIERTIHYCIKSGDFKRASFIINSVQSIIETGNLKEENIKILKRIYLTISTKPFLEEIGRIIDSEAIIDETELTDFVKHLDKTTIPSFIQLMGELQSIKSRRLIINILSIIGKLDIKTFAKGLQDDRWYVVRNIITILGKIVDTESIEYLTKSLSHPDQRVRKEAIKTIGSIGGLNTLPYLKNALNDESASVRITAARMLTASRTEIAKRILLAELSKEDFLSKDFTEKKEFYEFITRWQDDDLKNFLLEKLKKKKLLGKTKNDETRACAAYAIGILGYKDAIPELEKTKESKNKLLKDFSIEAIKRLTAHES